jgi:hypothetical protein
LSNAFILFDSRKHEVTLASLRSWFEAGGVHCSVGSWRFADASVPQLELQTEPPFAIQINRNANVVTEETADLLENGELEVSPSDFPRARTCTARLEIVSGAQPRISPLPEGGVLTSTADADLSSPSVRHLLRHLASFLGGWLWFNE